MLKPKNDEKSKRSRVSVIKFLAGWIAGHIVGWLAALALYEMFEDLFRYGELANALLISIIPGMIIAVVQMLVVKRGLKRSMRGWLPISFVGWLASALIYLTYTQNNFGGDILSQLLLLFLPAGIMQWFWLRQRVKAAWLWIIAAVVSAMVFIVPFGAVGYSYDGWWQYIIFALSGILQGSVTGLMMYTLQNQPQKTAQTAAYTARDEDAAAKAAERLQASSPKAESDADAASHTLMHIK